MKLREEKGWSYGAHSRHSGGQGTRMFIAGGSVQSDKTAESMIETDKLRKGGTGDAPVSAQELASAKESMTRRLSGEWASESSITSYLVDQAIDRLPADYYQTYAVRIEGESLAAVNSAGREVADQTAVWIVVGDRSKIESKIRATGLGEVIVVDADGVKL